MPKARKKPSIKRRWEIQKFGKSAISIIWKNGVPVKAPGEVLYISDIHWDNQKCDRELLKHDLDLAVEKDCPIIINGDFFCAMQGKYDPRKSKEALREEHRVPDYFDALVSTAADWWEPYKEHLALVAKGNHEASILEHHEVDLVERFVSLMRYRGSQVHSGGLDGWVRLRATGSMNSKSSTGKSRHLNMYYHHGWGSGQAQVTKGIIDFNRLAAEIDADIYALGHIHKLNADISCRTRLTPNGNIQIRRIYFIRSSTYKMDYDPNEHVSYAKKRGYRASPLGGWWISIMDDDRFNTCTTLKANIVPT